MARIHFIVAETAKAAYRDRALTEGKSLGAWLREAAEEKLAASRPRLFTLEELEEFNAACDARRPDGREPDWEESKRIIMESKLDGLREFMVGLDEHDDLP